VLALLALAAAVSAQVNLAPNLRVWRSEIEQSGVRVLFARVYTDSERNLLTLPADTPARPLFAAMLRQPAFVEQLVNAHALTTNLRGVSLVFLNMQRSPEWDGHEDALLAHELAHIALKARGYESLRASGLTSCQITHATNIVQHVLVRAELRRRGLDDVPFRVRSLETAQDAAAAGLSTGGSFCDQARRLEMWIDASIGLRDEQWPRRGEFLTLLRNLWPELAGPAEHLIATLNAKDVADKTVYESALAAAAETLRELK
jgi:hypothetical protein